MNWAYGALAALLLAIASFFGGEHVGKGLTVAHVDTKVIQVEKKNDAAQTKAADEIVEEVAPRNLYYVDRLVKDEAQSKSVAPVASIPAAKTVGENTAPVAVACVAPDSELFDLNGALGNAAIPVGGNVVPDAHASK